MAGLAFFSHRQVDTGMTAQALYHSLRERFGTGQLFMDLNSIDAGTEYRQRILSQLEEATVVVALIGSRWLTAADEDGRRRIDHPDDLLRHELAHTLQLGKPLLPVILGKETRIPRASALPEDLQDLPFQQVIRISLDVPEWPNEVRKLAEQLRRLGLTDHAARRGDTPMPDPRISRRKALGRDELAAALDEQIPGWEVWEDSPPGEFPETRQELRRTFKFPTFRTAVDFMTYLGPRFDEWQHHPIWTNEWTGVQIRLTTFDVGNRVTDLDVDTAARIDASCAEFLAQRAG
jgi:pterin-4a-carbinolamine dehydratase